METLVARGTATAWASAPACAPADDGERDEFAQVYEQTAPSVFRYAWSIVGDETLAEDVCGDVFLKAWRARNTFRGDASRLSWLLTIARNSALSALRTRQHEEATMTDVSPFADAWAATAPEKLGDADTARLREAIARLTGEQQKVIFLRFFEGLHHEEIASILGRNPAATRALQFRALSQLRRSLEDAR